jgi:hypothetical protein
MTSFRLRRPRLGAPGTEPPEAEHIGLGAMHFAYHLGPPRPYLHPIRTLAGRVITDAEPADHPWHLGLSLAMPDVNGTNLWGGRTYVRGQGYTWLDNHGEITHEGFASVADDRMVQDLAWRDPAGKVLLDERRTIEASPVDDRAWRLDFGWELTALTRVELGSPTTNGRELGAGYGGCFLRLAPDPSAEVSAGSLRGEDEVNGCSCEEVVWRTNEYEVTVSGASRWFVRTALYPGICAAWAYESVLVIEAGETWPGRMSLVIADR